MQADDTSPRQKKTHVCISCNYPIAVYGRCAPCLHVYCMPCASHMGTCLLCDSPIAKLEAISRAQPLYISAATIQGFHTRAEFDAHIQHLHQQVQHYKTLQQ